MVWGSAQGEPSHEVDPCQVTNEVVVSHDLKGRVVMDRNK